MGRRSFSEEFKLSAVKLVLEQSYTVAEACKSLGVDPSSLRSWLKQWPGCLVAASHDRQAIDAGRAASSAGGEQAAVDGA